MVVRTDWLWNQTSLNTMVSWLNKSIIKFSFQNFTSRWSKVIIVVIFILGMAGYILFETYTDFTRLRSLVGIFSIILFGFVFSGKLCNLQKVKAEFSVILHFFSKSKKDKMAPSRLWCNISIFAWRVLHSIKCWTFSFWMLWTKSCVVSWLWKGRSFVCLRWFFGHWKGHFCFCSASDHFLLQLVHLSSLLSRCNAMGSVQVGLDFTINPWHDGLWKVSFDHQKCLNFKNLII